MQRLDVLRIALRVLGAFRDSRLPDPQDVAVLKLFAPPGKTAHSADELACQVIEHALRDGAAPRFANASSPRSWDPVA